MLQLIVIDMKWQTKVKCIPLVKASNCKSPSLNVNIPAILSNSTHTASDLVNFSIAASLGYIPQGEKMGVLVRQTDNLTYNLDSSHCKKRLDGCSLI